MAMIINLFRESICQPSKSPHAHAHREILALDVGRADMLSSRIPGHWNFGGARAF